MMLIVAEDFFEPFNAEAVDFINCEVCGKEEYEKGERHFHIIIVFSSGQFITSKPLDVDKGGERISFLIGLINAACEAPEPEVEYDGSQPLPRELN